jgi:DNA repair exonuclease SbcCD ATPase subunit
VRQLSLTIRGVLRYADAVTVDCTQLPSGLIALVGENGEGKSTFLEAPLACLYRQFFTRSKDISDYAHDRDSYLEAAFDLEGAVYQCRLNVDAVKRASEAVIVRVDPDGTRTVLNDGKVTTYDQCIARIFPPRAVLAASAFSAQDGSGRFSSLEKSKRKDLFAKFLGLERLDAMSQVAKTAAGLVDAGRGRMLAQREILERDVRPTEDDALDTEGALLNSEAAGAERRRTALAQSIADVEAQLATVQDQVAARAVVLQKVRAIETELATAAAERKRVEAAGKAAEQGLVDERKRLADAHARAMRDLEARSQKNSATLRVELDKLDRDLAATLKDLDERIANNEALLADAAGIKAAIVAVEETDEHLRTARDDQARWLDKRSEIVTASRAVQAALYDAQTAEKDLKRAEADAQLVDDVPCQASGEYAGCQFLVQAIAAKGRIEPLREKAGAVPSLNSQLSTLNADLHAAADQLSIIATTIGELDAAKKKHQAKAALVTKVAEAETRLEDLRRKRDEAPRTADAARPEIQARALAREEELIADRDRATADRTAAEQAAEERAAQAWQATELNLRSIDVDQQHRETRLDSAKAELAAADQTNEQAQRWQGQLAGLRGEWDQATGTLARVDAGRKELDRRRQALADRRATLADLEGRLRTLDAELVEWQQLAKALARDGLQTLEIANAGPTVSAFTNDLLLSSFGARFTVEVVTQEARVSKSKNGDGMKETFSILVTDNERGGAPRDIGDLSGGEQVPVDEALANALAAYVNTRSATPIRTCWRDETTGPLSPGNRPHYLPMLRRLQQLAGFERIYLITHDMDVANQADAQLRFADGKVEIALPPYDQQRQAA